MKRSTKLQVFGAVLAGVVVATAQAAPPFNTLWFDINTLDLSITDTGGAATLLSGGGSAYLGGGPAFTGTMTFSENASSTFASVRGNNSGIGSFTAAPFSPAGDPGGLRRLDGVLTFSAGVVTGMFFEFENDAGPLGDIFHTAVPSGLPGVLTWDGSRYVVTGLTTLGEFTNDFGGDEIFGGPLGVDISKFIGLYAFGEFKDFFIDHSVSSMSNVQMEIVFAVPLPGGAAMASVGLLALGVRRRRN